MSKSHGLNALVLVGLTLSLYLARPILIPAVLALLLACMLWPLVRWLHERRLPWPVASAAAVSLFVVVVSATTVAFGLLVPRFAEALPSDPARAQEAYSRFRDRVQRLSPVALDAQLPERADDSALVAYVRAALDPSHPDFALDALKAAVGFGLGWLVQSVLVMFTLFFFLLEGRMLTRRLVELFAPGPAQARALAALQDMGAQVRTYLVWRTLVNVAVAVIMGLLYYLAGLSYPATWAMLTAVLLYVPYIGTVLAGMPPTVDAFLSCESPWVAVWLVVFYMALTTVEGYFIVPVVMGRSMDLNATTVMLSCLFWELVWGPAGLFLAMPVMAAAKTVCYHVPGWRPWANLMDTRDDPPDDAESPTERVPPAAAETAKTEVLPK